LKPIRCIHVITRLILGGAQENTLLTVEGLDRTEGYRASLATGPALGPEGSLIERARRNHVDLVILPRMRRAISPWRDPAALRDLTRLFKAERPEIVHTHSSKAGILGRMAARRAGIPVIIHSIHGPPFYTRQNPLANWAFRMAEKSVAGCTSRFISVADAMTDQFVAAGIAPREKFVTIYSGMEVEPFLRADGARDRVRAELNIPPDDIVIGKIARLFHLKGHEDVLRAFPAVLKRHPNARLLFVGNGILRESLEALARQLGIHDRVTFAGLVPTQRIPEMIKAMDLLVHASLREGLARVLPQALISGCPVVSYDVDGAREVVRDGETGFLVPAESVDGLRDALSRALGDLDAARRMARRGRELFTDQFRTDTMVRRIVEVYAEEMARAGLGR
jgi:glycosyltransferase involved in cell wall biosynthesis